jgi:hypothetical protein
MKTIRIYYNLTKDVFVKGDTIDYFADVNGVFAGKINGQFTQLGCDCF